MPLLERLRPAEGMLTLREIALGKAILGITSLEEVAWCTPE